MINIATHASTHALAKSLFQKSPIPQLENAGEKRQRLQQETNASIPPQLTEEIKSLFEKQLSFESFDYTKKEVLYNKTSGYWYGTYRCSKYRGLKSLHECKSTITMHFVDSVATIKTNVIIFFFF